MGVLLTKALSMAPITNVAKKDNSGLIDQSFANCRPMGSSAPVRTSACPAIINAQTATKSLMAKTAKKVAGTQYAVIGSIRE